MAFFGLFEDAPAPAPDPRIAASAREQGQLGRDYLDFAREQFAKSQGLVGDLSQYADEIRDLFGRMGADDRARWESVFRPLEDQYVRTAQDYASPERQADYAARARADVEAAAEREREAQQRQMMAMGVNPASGRWAGTDRAIGLGTAAASVDAENRAREALRDKGIALQRDAIGLGQGLTGQSAALLGAGLNAANAPLNAQIASQSIMDKGYSGALAGLKGEAATLGDLWKGQADIWKGQMDQQNKEIAGLGTLIGGAIGLGLTPGLGGTSLIGRFLSDRNAKKNIKPVRPGDALETTERLPIAAYDYKDGQGDGGSHVGPMAQDFRRETGRGDGRTIAVQDAIGLALGAVKDLSAKVDAIAAAVGLGRHKPQVMPNPSM